MLKYWLSRARRRYATPRSFPNRLPRGVAERNDAVDRLRRRQRHVDDVPDNRRRRHQPFHRQLHLRERHAAAGRRHGACRGTVKVRVGLRLVLDLGLELELRSGLGLGARSGSELALASGQGLGSGCGVSRVCSGCTSQRRLTQLQWPCRRTGSHGVGSHGVNTRKLQNSLSSLMYHPDYSVREPVSIHDRSHTWQQCLTIGQFDQHASWMR